MENFYEQLKNICAEHKTTIYAVEKKTGSGKGSFIKWRNSSPSADKLIEIADLLGISLDYLVGRDIQKQEETANIIKRPDYELSTELANLSKDKDFLNSAKLYNAVSDEYKKQICAYILGVATALGLNIAKILEQ